MKLCKHDNYRAIVDIWEPRYSTDDVLINVNKVDPKIEHYVIKFAKCNQYPDWFYLSGKVIRRHKTQKNGSGSVYVVPMSKREDFIALKNCRHEV